MNLKKDLTIDILSSVQKPARYTGGEFASIVKPAEEVEATIALAFPDVYEVGMSYLDLKFIPFAEQGRRNCRRTCLRALD